MQQHAYSHDCSQISLIGGLLSLFCFLSGPAQADPSGAKVLPLVDCIIAPSAIADVSSAVPGLLREVLVERSERVVAGQLLARLESGVEEARLAVAQARALIDAEVHLGQVNQTFDERRKDRVESMHASQAVSHQDRDNAAREAALSKWKLLHARDQLRLRELERIHAEEVLKQKTLRSPITGVVVQKYKSAGEYIEDQPVARVVKLDPLFVEAIVPINLFGRIQSQMAAEVHLETMGDKTYAARVAVVDEMGDAASGTFGVRLLLPNEDQRIPAGLRCSVRFLDTEPEQLAAETEPQQPVAELAPAKTDLPEPVQEFVPQETALSKVAMAVDESTPPQSQCLQMGPLEDRRQARQWINTLQAQGVDARLREVPTIKPAGYIVAARHASPVERRADVMARLARAGVRDFAPLPRSVYQGRVSLGVYKGPISAGRRQQQLAKLGVETELLERSRTLPAWWLELQTTLQREQLMAYLEADPGKRIPPDKIQDCSELRTAGF